MELAARINSRTYGGPFIFGRGYRGGRFISTYKRGVLGTDTELDLEIIGAGDKSAHGDAFLDAQLYEGPGTTMHSRVYTAWCPGRFGESISKCFFCYASCLLVES